MMAFPQREHAEPEEERVPFGFELDVGNPYFAKAAAIRDILAKDASRRDKLRGKPLDQIALLKSSGLLKLIIPKQLGGEGQSWSTVLRIIREFAQVDGSIAHLFGYHALGTTAPLLYARPDQSERLLRALTVDNAFLGNAVNSFSETLFGRVEGDFHILNGLKPFSSGSHVADLISVRWQDEESGEGRMATIPATREGLVPQDDWDGIGQTQTGSGRTTFKNVRIHKDELIAPAPDRLGKPFLTLAASTAHLVLAEVFVGSAQGALLAAREYSSTKSRPWVHSGVERHVDDPWVKRVYGELFIKTQAATLLADRAQESLDHVWAKGWDLTEAERGRHAMIAASANVYSSEVALDVGAKIFEVMGARSATNTDGFDRFWRNVRTHSLHNPAEYKTRNVGYWFLTDQVPEPSNFS